MFELLKKVLRDSFTERDGASYCVGRFIGGGGSLAAIYKFVVTSSPDYVSFGTCIAAIIAAIAAKNFSERDR